MALPRYERIRQRGAGPRTRRAFVMLIGIAAFHRHRPDFIDHERIDEDGTESRGKDLERKVGIFVIPSSPAERERRIDEHT